MLRNFLPLHCVKSVQIRSFSGPYFPLFVLNTGKNGPEKTPNLDTFHTVLVIHFLAIFDILIQRHF